MTTEPTGLDPEIRQAVIVEALKRKRGQTVMAHPEALTIFGAQEFDAATEALLERLDAAAAKAQVGRLDDLDFGERAVVATALAEALERTKPPASPQGARGLLRRVGYQRRLNHYIADRYGFSEVGRWFREHYPATPAIDAQPEPEAKPELADVSARPDSRPADFGPELGYAPSDVER